jgi:hypothetical protein
VSSVEDFGAQWRQTLEEDAPTQTVVMEVEGMRGRFRVFDIQGWAKTGRVPQFLVDVMFEAQAARAEGQALPLAKALTKEEWQEDNDFARDVVCYVGVEPRIVDKEESELGPGEVSYKTLMQKRPKFITAIVAWASAGCPNIPVLMADGGSTTVSAVENFRQEAERGAASQSGA